MMGISWMELMVIVVVALIVIGPKDLPVALRTLGRSVRAIRRMAGEFQSEVDQFIRDTDIESVRREVEDVMREAERASPRAKVKPAHQAAAPLPPAKDEPDPVSEKVSTQSEARTRHVA